MSRIIFENLKGWSPVDLVIRADELISDFIQEKINNIVERLLNNEPIQQIFGNTRWYGLTLQVTPATLIPRPETAELIDLIVHENPTKDLRVLDAGTGSGCIAIALKRNLVFPDVTAIDISEEALAVARANAAVLHASINFRHADILNLPQTLTEAGFDIIVSNPPYIADHEKATMERNVLDFEPHTALFVPDSDPLRFYIALLKQACRGMLRPGGKIYFEINPLYAKELKEATEQLEFANVVVTRDTDGKLRFLSAIKPANQ
jgi:release factor glutamine methyltransferase